MTRANVCMKISEYPLETNHAIIKHMIRNGGKVMNHPDFYDIFTSLCEGSCHLSLIGNDIFDYISRNFKYIY